MAKVRLEVANRSPEELTTLGNSIKTKMTGNANFTTPSPTLASLDTAIALVTSKVAAATAAKVDYQAAMDARDNAAAALARTLSLLATYVESASGGDAAKIQSAGMGIRSVATPVGLLPQVLNLRLQVTEEEGQVLASWKVVPKCRGYQVQWCQDPITDAGWRDGLPALKSSAKLTGLPSGKKVWVRVRAVSSKPENNGPWSDVAARLVP